MNKHLESAYKRDTRKKTCLINPISKTDADIIQELIIALGRIENHRSVDLKKIVENWKYLKDQDIADLLLEFNTNNPLQIVNEEEIEKDKSKRKFIDFDGEIIEIQLIKTIGKDNSYNFKYNRNDYRIIINKDLEEKFMLNNGVFSFLTELSRDEKLEELKNKLKDFIKII